MWAAIVLVCHLDMAPIFENNLTDQIEIPDRKCYMSMAPALLKDERRVCNGKTRLSCSKR